MHQLTFKVRVLSGYRITLPKPIRERLGISVGDELTLVVRGNEISIVIDEEEPIMLIAGIVSGSEEIFGDEIFLEEIEEKMKRSKE